MSDQDQKPGFEIPAWAALLGVIWAGKEIYDGVRDKTPAEIYQDVWARVGSFEDFAAAAPEGAANLLKIHDESELSKILWVIPTKDDICIPYRGSLDLLFEDGEYRVAKWDNGTLYSETYTLFKGTTWLYVDMNEYLAF